MTDEARLARTTATAILGIDTLWGGDVLNPSGTGRFIADSWFSDERLPEAYTHPAAGRLRETGGVAAKQPDRAAVDAYLAAVDVPGAVRDMVAQGRALGGLRGAYLDGMGASLEAMWELVQELLGGGVLSGHAPLAEDALRLRHRQSLDFGERAPGEPEEPRLGLEA